MVKDAWDNRAALRSYPGPVDLYGTLGDRVIPVAHARRLAAAVPQTHLILVAGGHNDWPDHPEVWIVR